MTVLATGRGLAVIAVLAFAANSLVARAAIAEAGMGAGTFTAIRLVSGALILIPFLGRRPSRADVPGAAALLVYAAAFGFAYQSLGAAAGALILFTTVQATIIGVSAWRGERLSRREAAGLMVAALGVAWLLLPRAGSPDPAAAVLMMVAGMAWGAYTLLGRKAGDATGRTARAFLLAAPVGLFLPGLDADMGLTGAGVALAVLAGAFASGIGYVIWSRAAPNLSLGGLAASQLATPAVAALGAVLFLAEPMTFGLAGAGVVTLAGVGLAVTARRPGA
jgi:drug/metabolite transporter (DMT)-like permease